NDGPTPLPIFHDLFTLFTTPAKSSPSDRINRIPGTPAACKKSEDEVVSYLPYKVVIPPPKKYVFPKTPPAICLQGRAGHGSTELAEVSVPAAESHETPGISSMSFCRLVQDLAKRRWVETSLPAVSQVEPPAVSQVEPPAVSQVEPLRIARAEAPAPRPAAQPNATSTPSLQLRTHTRRYPPSRSVVECGV